MTPIRIAGTSTSTIDGIGISFNIFFQGCNHNCIGCQNPTLQNFTNGHDYTTEDILDHLAMYPDFYDSVVFTGGDPAYQPNALYNLATNCKILTVLYTGFYYHEIPEHIRQVITIIIDGPYVQSLATNGFPASSNQQVWIRGHPISTNFQKSLTELYSGA